jgi:Phytanoyl-CoA dioxygenase (PhyH)
MWRLKRWGNKAGDGGTAVAEPPAEALEDFDGGTDELLAEIERLSAANRSEPDRATERRLVRLRHVAGRRLLDAAHTRPDQAAPDTAGLPAATLPEIAAADLTPGLLRAGILRDGCLLVRGLVPREDALAFAASIDRVFAERERADAGGSAADGFYEEFAPHPRFKEVAERPWIKEGGGVLGADSPLLTFEMLELFRGAGLPELVGGYLGERPLFSVQKTTLRKADPAVGGAWHQDGAFLGDVRALNLWLALSRCGDEAPGLDIVPRRLDHFVEAGTDEAVLSYQIAQSKAEQAAAGAGILRPVFDPGDALFFDEMFLHQTGSDPSMPNPRFAIENWFFGPSGFPAEFAPLAV